MRKTMRRLKINANKTKEGMSHVFIKLNQLFAEDEEQVGFCTSVFH